MTDYNKTNDLKNEWERVTDRKIQSNTVQRRMKNMLQSHEFAVEARREKYTLTYILPLALILYSFVGLLCFNEHHHNIIGYVIFCRKKKLTI